MPGDLVGKTMNGSDCALESFNMLYYDIRTSSGNIVEIDPNSSISMSIRTSLPSIANASLWYHDGSKWIEIEKPRAISG